MFLQEQIHAQQYDPVCIFITYARFPQGLPYKFLQILSGGVMEIIAEDLGLQYRIHIILLFLQFVKQDCPAVFLFDFYVKFLQDRYELFFMDGLQDIIINPVLDCLLRVFKIAVACKKDNMGLILQFPDFFNQVNPIHARHGNVHNGISSSTTITLSIPIPPDFTIYLKACL